MSTATCGYGAAGDMPRISLRSSGLPCRTRKDVATHFRIPAAPRARALPEFCPPSNKRAQGKPDARCTRGLVCKQAQKKRTRAYRSSGGDPAFPARWFTAYTVLSLVTGLSCHHRPQSLLCELEHQHRGVRTTRFCRPPRRRSSKAPPRPPHPAPTFVTMANAPLTEQDGCGYRLSCDF